jgi:16S rRNA processing protein RimM
VTRPEPSTLVAVGEILRPVGLRGELRVRPLTDRPAERFPGLGECFLWEPTLDRREPCRVLASRLEGTMVLVRLAGIEGPEAAAALSGWLLAVDREDALPPGDGCFYPWELAGARVLTTEGRDVGGFLRVEASPAQDLWVIGDGSREWLLPAVPDIVVEVSVAARRIVIDPPDGLLDL